MKKALIYDILYKKEGDIMNVKIGVSNRHVHLTKEDYKILFGNYDIKNEKDLIQVGEFASSSKVSISTEKSTINNVRVLGPFRNYTQVEISKTDSFTLGINPPIRNSGDIEDSEIVTIIGPVGQVRKKCCIIATRHIHINPSDRKELGLANKETVSVKIGDEKSSVLEKVYIKESEFGVFEFHIDTDDANACLIKSGDIGTIID